MIRAAANEDFHGGIGSFRGRDSGGAGDKAVVSPDCFRAFPDFPVVVGAFRFGQVNLRRGFAANGFNPFNPVSLS